MFFQKVDLWLVERLSSLLLLQRQNCVIFVSFLLVCKCMNLILEQMSSQRVGDPPGLTQKGQRMVHMKLIMGQSRTWLTLASCIFKIKEN